MNDLAVLTNSILVLLQWLLATLKVFVVMEHSSMKVRPIKPYYCCFSRGFRCFAACLCHSYRVYRLYVHVAGNYRRGKNFKSQFTKSNLPAYMHVYMCKAASTVNTLCKRCTPWLLTPIFAWPPWYSMPLSCLFIHTCHTMLSKQNKRSYTRSSYGKKSDLYLYTYTIMILIPHSIVTCRDCLWSSAG